MDDTMQLINDRGHELLIVADDCRNQAGRMFAGIQTAHVQAERIEQLARRLLAVAEEIRQAEEGDEMTITARERVKMTRVQLTDGSGRWFDHDAATRYVENQHWDGHNFISDATGSQWEHETLYHTASAKWVIHHYSQWEGARDSYNMIDTTEAHKWLLAQGHDSAMPASVLQAYEI